MTVFIVTDIEGTICGVCSTRRKAVKRAYDKLDMEEDDNLDKLVTSEASEVSDGDGDTLSIEEFIVDDENL